MNTKLFTLIAFIVAVIIVVGMFLYVLYLYPSTTPSPNDNDVVELINNLPNDSTLNDEFKNLDQSLQGF